MYICMYIYIYTYLYQSHGMVWGSNHTRTSHNSSKWGEEHRLEFGLLSLSRFLVGKGRLRRKGLRCLDFFWKQNWWTQFLLEINCIRLHSKRLVKFVDCPFTSAFFDVRREISTRLGGKKPVKVWFLAKLKICNLANNYQQVSASNMGPSWLRPSYCWWFRTPANHLGCMKPST